MRPFWYVFRRLVKNPELAGAVLVIVRQWLPNLTEKGARLMSRDQWLSIAKGAGLAVAGAALAYAADLAAGGRLGHWGLALAPVLSVLLNVVRKAMAGDDTTDPPAPTPTPTPIPAPPRILAALLVCLCLPAFAQAEVKITGETKVGANRLVRLHAKGVGDKAGVLWRVYPPQHIDKATSPRCCLEFAAPPGTYTVEVLVITSGEGGAIGVEEARVEVVIGTVPPTPPGPGPGPNPPPPPTPPPPEDQLTRDLRAAILADPGDPAAKAKWVADLADLYRLAVATADDAKLTTSGSLLAALKQASASVLPPTALRGVRNRIATELDASLPTDIDAPLTPAVRTAAKGVFARISAALKGGAK